MSLDLNNLYANARFLVEELLTRGVAIEPISDDSTALWAQFDSHAEILVGVESSIVPRPAVVISDNKFITKRLLQRAGISVPRGAEFDYQSLYMALDFAARELKGPVVLKPTIGTHGHDVFLPLDTLNEVEQAIEAFHDSQPHSRFILEEFFPAEENRVFITRNGHYAVLHREPASVVGDGTSTIRELAERESDFRMNPRKGCLCEIALDEPAKLFLAKKGLSFESIPMQGEKIILRANSNLKTGGTCVDVTDVVHPSVIEIAKRTLSAIPGLPYAGIDFMSKDITAPQTSDTYRIIEVNSEPSIGIHIAPWKGKSHNVAAWIADMIFPETAVST